MWKIRKIILSSVLFLLFLLAPSYGFISRAEAQYIIYESELNQLEMNLNKLQKNNNEKQKLLNEQEKQLTEAKNQINQLETSNKKTIELLEKANQSLMEYEKEAEKKVKVKTRQRNFWMLVAGMSIFIATK